MATKYEKRLQVLIVEDDEALASRLRRFLVGRMGWEASFYRTIRSALVAVSDHAYDVVISEAILPDGTASVILQAARDANPACVAVVMSGLSDPALKERALRCGADQFVNKPFSFKDLASDLSKLMNLPEADISRQPGLTIEVGESGYLAENEEMRVKLTKMERRVLDALVQANGQIVSRDLLFTSLLDRRYEYGDRTFDVHVGNLRRKLSKVYGDRFEVKPVHGRGYQLIETG